MLSFIERFLGGVLWALQGESVRRWSNPFSAWRSELFYFNESDSMEPERPETYTTDTTEYGLTLPNGLVMWQTPDGQAMASPAQRAAVVNTLTRNAQECGFTPEQFLSHYNWVVRRVQTTITNLGTLSLTDPRIIGGDPTEHEDSDDSDHDDQDHPPANGDGGDLRAGSVGGAAPGAA